MLTIRISWPRYSGQLFIRSILIKKDNAGNSFSGGGLFLPEAENDVTSEMHTIQAGILPCISSMDTFLYRWLATDSSITETPYFSWP